METNANQKVSCMVNFAYDASESDELTIRPGDVIRDVERLSGGWWRGELRGRRGMFPDNFVSVLEHANSRSAGVQGRCRAVFSYQPANPDELPLCVGDVLEVLGEVEEGWWQGRRQGRVGVFPSNFVVMLDPPQPAPPYEPAPALPPKPVREQCRVLFPYSAVNEDELSLAEGDVLTLVSRDAPDRGWWRGELRGRVGLFPDNFVQLLPATSPVAPDVEDKKPDRPAAKTTNAIYPILNKYSEKTASVKELTTSKISVHKDNTISKETSTQSTVTHTNKSESEKIVHNESVNDATAEQVRKPPVPLKKSPTPTSGVGSLFSGLKNKMLSSTDKDKAQSSAVSSGSSSGGEWDRPDGAAAAKPAPASTFDHVERHCMLSDPRAARVKAPRRRPPSQALRDDAPLPAPAPVPAPAPAPAPALAPAPAPAPAAPAAGLSNGHDVAADKPPDKAERGDEIRPRAREWEKHKAPWMEELKLNQAKKTGDARPRPAPADPPLASKAAGGSTDRILDCGLEERRSTHSMEMSKSTSSISSRMSVLESFEETKARHSLDSRSAAARSPEAGALASPEPGALASPEAGARALASPTAAGRTILSMLDDIKKPQAPPPPLSPLPAPPAPPADRSPSARPDGPPASSDKPPEINALRMSTSIFEKTSTLERIESSDEKVSAVSSGKISVNSAEKVSSTSAGKVSANSAERASTNSAEKSPRADGDALSLIAQLNSRISNLEKLIEVQNSMFSAHISELQSKLKLESDARRALRAELDKLATCVTQV